MFKVIERFISIDGEGPTSGELAAFIRFEGCNLRCTWCDTKYSWDGSCSYEDQDAEGIYQYIKDSGARNVTLTGGEPLLQKDMFHLLDLLSLDSTLHIHIETNGAIDIGKYKVRYQGGNIRYIVDYKLPASGMERTMKKRNFEHVDQDDVIKFVIASEGDLQETWRIVNKHELTRKCRVFLSPVAESFEPKKIVEFMVSRKWHDVRLQVQVHKVIWPKDMRGV
ncbi:putative 7-carboxy-7-deazaguanine synthase QueE [Pradoshia sp.]